MRKSFFTCICASFDSSSVWGSIDFEIGLDALDFPFWVHCLIVLWLNLEKVPLSTTFFGVNI
tara:strand:+ start:1218 stop:1403 length:186 start_codon:yes stop_codon:yes gene_type:complete